MTELQRGLYETFINRTLQDQLNQLSNNLSPRVFRVNEAEAPDRFSLHLALLLKRAFTGAPHAQRVELAQRIITLLVETEKSGLDESDLLTADGEMLQALCHYLPNGKIEDIQLPDTPLADTTLLTNSPGEPRVGHQLLSEIDSADRIELLVAFIRRSGIRTFLDAFRKHCEQGKSLRILTTTYTNSTELEALLQLRKLGAEIKVSYDTTASRLHAKAWLFFRKTGFSTAYIGSSNLTQSAQFSGLEWNLRLSAARNPDAIGKFTSVFESLWAGNDFREFDVDEFTALTDINLTTANHFLSPLEIRPEPFQAQMLEQLALARTRDHHRNLLVSATGTGKTVMAALDYTRLRDSFPRARLLFVAHRKEILQQSLATFRQALRDAAFGELWVDGRTPTRFEHVFASIQSLSATGLGHLAPDHFDVVIVDEFHRAAASTYDRLLHHLKPKELLGLTATPERADGKSVLDWFDGRIAAELRLWDAIDQQRLAPFVYYGISDGLDLRRVDWLRGRGYDALGLDNIMTGNDTHARLIIKQVLSHIDRLESMSALGFCVSIKHAHFMADHFNRAGIAAAAVSGATPGAAREQALFDLKEGRLHILFSVDVFNEGIDLPDINTLLLLRPTDSATIFLQQLGRGLRKKPGKQHCLVLDFISQHRQEYRFTNRMRALLGGSRRELIEKIEHDFPILPSGCHLELDRLAKEVVLQNIKASIPSLWRQKAEELRALDRDKGAPVSLGEFLFETGMELDDIYSNGHCWSDFQEAAGRHLKAPGPDETRLRRALGRMLHLDDERRISCLQSIVHSSKPPAVAGSSEDQKRLLRLLAVLLLDTEITNFDSLEKAIDHIWQHPQVLNELAELLVVLDEQAEHLTTPLAELPEVPLSIGARYTRLEILAAFTQTSEKLQTNWREGVKWFPACQTDVALVTLDKTGKRFSPTTRYRDYAISRADFHWESQSTVRETSPTGQRYQSLRGDKTGHFMLFVRMTPNDRSFWFLGPATYLSHEGERPMAIKWKLKYELSGDLFAKSAAIL